MRESIDIRQSDVTSYSSGIDAGAQQLEYKTLSPKDEKSTITANSECQIAFERNQKVLVSLMDAVKRESSMIEQLGTEFQAVDNCLAQMISTFLN